MRAWRSAVAAWQSGLADDSERRGEAVRRLVWEKLAAALPADTTMVYLAPDGSLTQMPWAALPVAVLFYEQMLAIARRAGLIKQPDQTPVEFALASGLTPIREITILYNRVRFGGAELDENETRRVSELLGKLKQDVRGKRYR